MKVPLLTALFLLLAAESAIPQVQTSPRRSGYDFMSRETRAMQDDDAANPGTLGVLDGEALWMKKEGAAEKACADCHGDAAKSMKGVAARYPAVPSARKSPINMEQRINACRVDHQRAEPLPYESRDLLALTAYVGQQSRGMPITISGNDQTKRFVEAGREAFVRRQGQINLSCKQCHDDNPGKRLAGSVIPQAHPTGYPIYRLEWQSLGSLQRRLRNCLAGMRAEVPELGSPELVELELYLMWRARGMKVETPAVRP